MQDSIYFHDKNGDVIAETKGGFLVPLLAAAAGPVLNALLTKVLGKGATSMSCGGRHAKVRKTKGGSMDEEIFGYLVPHVQGRGVHNTMNHNSSPGFHGHGGAAGFGAAGFGAVGFGGFPNFPTHGGNSVQYGEVTYPTGGAATKKKRSHKKKGGFAVNQQMSGQDTGFMPGKRVMFPVNLA